MLLFLIFIFVVSNIMCALQKCHYKITDKLVENYAFFFFLANEIPLIKFP